MERAPNAELAKRVNQAFLLLNKGTASPRIVERLMKQYGVSYTQAYRYVQQAKRNNGTVAIPERAAVFTVKQPPTLINRVKKLARAQGLPISHVVRTALEEFLAKKQHAAKQQTS